ncbi:MAG: diheme cytochrome c [Paracoccaceae bacterium]
MRPIDHPTTQAECSACHTAYPAGFLPARSWKTIMATLDDHFGENAAVDEAMRAEIESYLVANAADAAGRSSGILRGVAPDTTPLRISELPWFIRKHSGEVSPQMKERAGSMANCTACHRGAAQGRFEDD